MGRVHGFMLRALTALTWLLVMLAPAAAIVGGAPPADESVARHVVMVSGSAGVCSGVAIAPDLVLTAAHCTVRSGNFKLAAPDGKRLTARNVAVAVAHPQFAPREDAPDVALVKLAPQPKQPQPKLT